MMGCYEQSVAGGLMVDKQKALHGRVNISRKDDASVTVVNLQNQRDFIQVLLVPMLVKVGRRRMKDFDFA